MTERIADLMHRLAGALESPPCRDFDELVARALPAVRDSRDIALLDVEAGHVPPRILLATGSGWILFVDLDGLRAYKAEQGPLVIPDDGRTPAAVHRRFARRDPAPDTPGQRDTG